MALHAVILAGGLGERFWPASTPENPKPFARLFGQRTLLEETLLRAARFAEPANTWLVGGVAHSAQLRLQADGRLPRRNVLLEPARRDTAAAVALAAATIAVRDPDGLLAVLPSDHHVPDAEAFAETIAEATVAARAGHLTCVGIPALRPESRYGYIVRGEAEVAPGVHAAVRFVEKPSREQALALMSTGRAYWNAGLVVCTLEAMLEAFARHAPAFHAALGALGGGDAEARAAAYAALPSISLDYAVLQQARRVAVARAGFRWHDVGTWAELPNVEADADGNFTRGAARLVQTRNSVVYNTGANPVVAHGLDGVLVAAVAGHVTLVSALGADNRALLHELERGGGVPAPDPFAPFLEAAAAAGPAVRVVAKPWGHEILWAHSGQYAAKVIAVRAGQSLSRQYHERKRETHWYLFGAGLLEHDGRPLRIRPGLVVTIAPGEIHRVEADADTCFLEVSTPQLDDVVRLEDRYGRADPGVAGGAGPGLA